MKSRAIFLLTAVVVAVKLSGCASVRYEGPSYTPTDKVQVFYDKSHIKRNYDVMGTATASTWYSYRGDALKAALLDKARAKGADAVLIQSISEKVSDQPARVDPDSPISGGSKASDNPGVLPREDSPHGEPQTTVTVKTSKIVADFLKYKD